MLFLLDGHALVYRAFYAMISRPLRTSSGENTSAPYGLARFLIRLLEEEKPEYLAVIFDAGDSFRTQVFPDYKATREKMPEELAASLPRCRELLEAFRIPVVEAEGWEADDVIGTLAVQAEEADLHSVIVSGDKDFYQLIGPRTSLLNPGRRGPAGVEQEWVTVENAGERLGVEPAFVTDYLALLGDSSDNIPGVRGIGRKTAPGLIRTFGPLEEILAHAAEVPSARTRKALEEHAQEARLSKALATIRTDAPVKLEPERLKKRPPDRDRLREVFLELEFYGLAREYAPEREPEREAEAAPRFELAETPARLEEALSRLAGAERVALWVEGSSPDPMRGRLVGVAVAETAGGSVYLPFGHRPPQVARDAQGNPALALDGEGSVKNLPPLESLEMEGVRALLAGGPEKVGHDLKYAAILLERFGVSLSPLAFDTSLASYCLDPGRRDHSLELLVLDRFGHTPALMEHTAEQRGGPVEEVSPEEESRVAGTRASYILRLAAELEEELRRDDTYRLFEQIELPLVEVLAAMEREGIRIDAEFFGELEGRIDRELGLVLEEIRKVAGEEVNLRSVPQLRELLFERLALPVIKRTKTGPSTDETVLVELAARGHEIPRLILEYRELDKLKGTYVSKLPLLVHPETGRIHTRFNQTVAATGRLSSSEPNLQNIPIRSSLGREIRKGFVPEPGYLFVCADYSQIELRVLAHLSADEAFLRAFRAGRDIHTETAAGIFGVEPERVTPGMRDRAKTINFATIYGQGPVALATQLGISRREAEAFIREYFERFSGVAAYLERMKEEARENGYVRTLSGRRRYIPEIRSRNPGIRGFGERTATNSPIQGSAADLIKIAMIRLHPRLKELPARMILQVHDELLFEVKEEEVESIRELVRGEMEGAMELAVPLRVEIGVGESWYACKA